MRAIFHDPRHFPLDQTERATTPAPVHEPHFDFSLAGAGVAVLLWMALFVGFLYSWFTMGS